MSKVDQEKLDVLLMRLKAVIHRADLKRCAAWQARQSHNNEECGLADSTEFGELRRAFNALNWRQPSWLK